MNPVRSIPRSKRLFDLTVTVLVAPFWMPVCLLAALALRLTAGAPVLYASKRRIFGHQSRRIIKFRTMVRDAERVLNRDTVPITDTCFLNIPPEHPVYTPVGRFIERFALTELPQLLHVLQGQMSLVGNRPLPENVIQALRAHYPCAEDRFLMACGLTGPVQLVGRDAITDAQRLAIEIDYCLLANFSYRWRIDILILLNTVLVALKLRPGFSVDDVRSLMARSVAPRVVPQPVELDRRRAALRFQAPRPQAMLIDGQPFEVQDFGYRGMRLRSPHRLQPDASVVLAGDGLARPELQAKVCWSRELPAGGFEFGLSVQSENTWSDHLHTMMIGLSGARPAGAGLSTVSSPTP